MFTLNEINKQAMDDTLAKYANAVFWMGKEFEGPKEMHGVPTLFARINHRFTGAVGDDFDTKQNLAAFEDAYLTAAKTFFETYPVGRSNGHGLWMMGYPWQRTFERAVEIVKWANEKHGHEYRQWSLCVADVTYPMSLILNRWERAGGPKAGGKLFIRINPLNYHSHETLGSVCLSLGHMYDDVVYAPASFQCPQLYSSDTILLTGETK